ncbi:MAG: MarR family winged helix-turn-helix transcriptional regulator [Gemmatimonadaceae bacterium]
MPDTTAAQKRALKLFVVLARANRAVEEHMAGDIKRHGLTPVEFAVMEALYHKGPMLLGEVQRKILLSSGGITYVVDRLEGKQLVERQECPGDRRARFAALTKHGEALMRRIFPLHAGAIERAMAGLGAREQEELTSLLKKLGLSAAASAREARPHQAAAAGPGAPR